MVERVPALCIIRILCSRRKSRFYVYFYGNFCGCISFAQSIVIKAINKRFQEMRTNIKGH